MFIHCGFPDRSVPHANNTVCHTADLLRMGNENDCPVMNAAELLQNIQDLLSGLIIKGAGRLITEQNGCVFCPI